MVFGVFATEQRTREIGVCIALGALARDIVRRVRQDTSATASRGLAVGRLANRAVPPAGRRSVRLRCAGAAGLAAGHGRARRGKSRGWPPSGAPRGPGERG